jgi:hypothetical protein
MVKKFIYVIIFLMSALIIFSGCENKDANVNDADIPDNINMSLIDRVGKRFEEIYLAYNEQRFDDYISYYRIDEDQKNGILEAVKGGAESYTSRYEIRNVLAFENEGGDITATIVYYTISSIPDGETFIIEETMYYTLIEENGNLFISSFELGAQTLVE